MKPRTQLILTSFGLALFVLASFAYTKWDQWFQKTDKLAEQSEQPDMVAISLEQLSFDEQGNKEFLLNAESMLQYLASNRNIMVKPTITFFENQKASWITSAASATSTTDASKLNLSGQVVIVQQGVREAAVLETETLELHPRESYATTDDKVVIRQTGVYIEAFGLDADLNENRILLRQKVTSIYEPEDS
ncbi:MAG: LPS export ABC transporter periplasmic protein LptC [Pseudomonadota bacterium]|nr:LPS export ABC transporter periplasmic protein LptC [Pseudomonadota bacterium]